jgi:FAD/FMN-containing dehydrogenase
VAVVQAGVALEALQSAAIAHGLEPGIDLAARGTATIGGMVSTNAGGIMAHRYGVMRHRVLGLEAVLPDGTIYSDMTRVVKNTAGYDLKHLFIGAEGTLGIVTRVVIKLEPLPQCTATVMLGLPSVAATLEAINLALRSDAGHLRAAEGLWQSYIQLTARAQGWSEPSFPLDQPICLLLMLGGANEANLNCGIEQIFGEILDRHPTATGIIAASKRQEADLWRLREDTDHLYRAHAAAPSYDVSVPLSEVGAYVDHVKSGLARIDADLVPYVFGHLADGNLHIVLNRAGPLDDAISGAVELVLYANLRALGGSFSAEHGVGAKRIAALVATSDPVKLATMMRIKQALDPDQTLNPGKVLPSQPLAREKFQ